MRAYGICLFAVLVGGLIFAYGSSFPQYSDPAGELKLNDESWIMRVHADTRHAEQIDDEWFKLKATLQTPRDGCHDLGAGIALLGLSVAAMFALTGVRRTADVRQIQSPRTRWGLCLSVALAWMSFVPARMCFWTYTLARGDYPPDSDIVFIPIASDVLLCALLLPIMLGVVLTATIDRRLPVHIGTGLGLGPPSLPNAFLWVALVLSLLVLGLAVTSEPPIVPSAVWSVYLVLCVRATARSPRAQRAAPDPIGASETNPAKSQPA